MKKRIALVLALAAVLIMATVVSAGATRPTDVYIEVKTSLSGDPSPFVASGQAVEKGLICATGEVIDESGKLTGFSKNGFNYQGIKHFTCDDETGEFFVNLQARIDRKGDNFNWNILRGTGAYEDLHGAGRGIGLPDCGPACVVDIYDGGLHIDP